MKGWWFNRTVVGGFNSIRRGLFYVAPLLAVWAIVVKPLGAELPQLSYMLAVVLWMVLWWISEEVPLGITSLLPVVLFPLLGIMDGKAVSALYVNQVIFLFMGGFMVAIAVQKWELHRRIALWILMALGTSPSRILLGFMLATAVLSMWISNTATTMMMIPMALSVLGMESRRSSPFGRVLLLGIAYSASIGGVATLVGTPPNLSFTRIYEIYYPQAEGVSFGQWMLWAFPLSIGLLLVLFIYLRYVVLWGVAVQVMDVSGLRRQLKAMGDLSYEERAVMAIFVVLALLWIFRKPLDFGIFRIPGWSTWLPYGSYLHDGTVAIAMAVLLFVLPAKRTDGYLMSWADMRQMPWDLILLFGGGFALAGGLKESGLADWLGQHLQWMQAMPLWLSMWILVLMVSFLTEMTSNTATVESFLPVLAGLAGASSDEALLWMIPATVAASMAFMLPIATPPNAIVFGTGKISMVEMMRVGFVFNIVAGTLVAIYFFLLLSHGVP